MLLVRLGPGNLERGRAPARKFLAIRTVPSMMFRLRQDLRQFCVGGCFFGWRCTELSRYFVQ